MHDWNVYDMIFGLILIGFGFVVGFGFAADLIIKKNNKIK